MAFFDELSKKASSIAASAQKTANVAKIQHQISQKQSEFDALYHQIGQIYYSCRQRGVQPDESIGALCDRVTALCQEIEELRGEVDRIRNVRRCAACGKVIDRNVKFCPNCGAKVAEEAPKAEEAPEAAEEPKTEDSKVYINWPKAEEKLEEKVDDACAACGGCACSCGAEEAPEGENADSDKAE